MYSLIYQISTLKVVFWVVIWYSLTVWCSFHNLTGW